MKRTLTTFVALTCLLSACKKDDSGNDNNTRKGNLTSGSWRITSSSAVVEYPAPIGTRTVDVLGAFPACTRDNLFIFNSDNTSTTDEGATKCNTSDPQQKTSGTWALLNSDTQLQVSDPSSPGAISSITADILELNNSTLKIKYAYSVTGIQTTTTTTYGR